jgi:hypothetical protein
VTLLTSVPAESGGGGSNAVFSLDRESPALGVGLGPSTLFVDDPDTGAGGSLMLALPATGLGLTPAHNVDALASGKENGVLAILIAVASGVPNPLDIAAARYQFSAERLAVDGVTGFVPVPFDLVPPPPIITQRADFEPQFVEMDQAADIFDNVALVDRFNFPILPEEGLELTGTPLAPGAIDNVDAFSSLGSFGVVALDADFDSYPDVPVYYSTDALTDGSGLLRGTIFVKPAGAGPVMVYATPAALGLGMLDDIDGLSIWEDESPANLVFDAGDGVVFSLREGSPTLPVVMDDVVIDEGGIFLALPGEGIVAALPAGYFSLSPEDDLDGLHVVDPRSGFPGPCSMGPTPSAVAPFGSLMLVQNTMEMMESGLLEIFVYLSDTERVPDAGGITDFSVTAMISDPVARFTSGSTPLAGPPFPPGCNGGCADDHPRFPPCAGMSAEFMACALLPGLSGPNQCLGCFTLEPLANGEALVTVTAGAVGEFGPIDIGTAYTTFRVSGLGSTAVVEAPRVAAGLRTSPNPFLSSVRIDLAPGSAMASRVLIHDVMGRLVRVLSVGAGEAASITWDGRDREGRSVPPGFYVVRTDAAGEVRTAKVLRIR